MSLRIAFSLTVLLQLKLTINGIANEALDVFDSFSHSELTCCSKALETSQKLLEVEKWSPEGDDVALRNSTFIRRFEPTGRPPWMTLILPKLSGKFQPAKLA